MNLKLVTKLERLRAENKLLKERCERLKPWIKHDTYCQLDSFRFRPESVCTCGLSDALKGEE